MSTGLCDCPEGFVSNDRICMEIGDNMDLKRMKRVQSDLAILKRAHNLDRGIHPGYPIHMQWDFGKRATPGDNANPIPTFKFSDKAKYLIPAVINELMSSYALLRHSSQEQRQHGQCIAVQIRRGDACSGRPCFPVKVYVHMLKKMLTKYGGTPSVFVATDDQTALQEINKELRALGLRTRSLDVDRSIYSTTRLESNPKSAGSQFATEIIMDIWEMSFCDMFVGSMRASPFRMAYLLAVGRNGYYPPFISLETSLGDYDFAHQSPELYVKGGRLHGKTCVCTKKPIAGRGRYKQHDCKCDALVKKAELGALD